MTDALLRGFGGGGLDPDEMLAQSSSTWVDDQKAAAASAAEADGVNSTPSFQAGPTGGALAPLQFQALDAARAIRNGAKQDAAAPRIAQYLA